VPYLTIDGASLFYAPSYAGQDTAHNLVLIHGAVGNHLQWPADLRRLSGTNVYALDLPGHGRSEGNGYPSIASYAGTIQQFMDYLDLRSVTLLGHSMGGGIALTQALQADCRLNSIVIIASAAQLRTSAALLNSFRTAISAGNLGAGLCEFSAQLFGTTAQSGIIEPGRQLLATVSPTTLLNDYLACDSLDLTPHLGQIALPVLVIGGREDNVVPIGDTLALAQSIPNAQWLDIEGTGHMLILEKPDTVTRAIQDFLQQTHTSGD